MNKDNTIITICLISIILISALIFLNINKDNIIKVKDEQLQNKSEELLSTKQSLLIKEDRVISLLKENVACRELVVASSQIIIDNFYLLYLSGNAVKLDSLTKQIQSFAEEYKE